ncbi:MAG TPA: hypothetical protein VHL58_11575 [Thermoanaerobaculia bacterium]|nr:hypothetical protein [Thermoanaerobaculia bacterium]
MAGLKGSLIATAIIFLLLGGVAGYFAISIPRDVKAEALLGEARVALQKNNRDGARKKFEQVITQFPRTDSGAAAMYALFRMVDQDRAELKAQIDKQLRDIQASQKISQSRLSEVEKAAASRQITVAAPAPAPAVSKPIVIQKSSNRSKIHSTPTRHRRR